jgi:DNA-directed RNA polymerase subunit alpha|uniref:DNA-directed RNA polymerase subunit alpha n=1 Tax=Equisetum hyemale TaxID=3262 RepID=M9PIG5_EQUHY|nr:DNA-directed RNA polymerase subunit alpha [Equisetum hyemale]AGC26659.1 DNA-directed RNA polymerase subunit alpha [Equisetum hyemale]
MIEDELPISVSSVQWKCVESRIESKRLHYGRFAISPFQKGQANTVGIAIRRALLGEVGGTSITSAKFEGAVHEYSTMTGIQESIHDILMNLKEIVLENNSYEVQKGFIQVIGPKKILAEDIQVCSSVKIIDPSQYIATITKSISLNIELKIEKDRGYRIKNTDFKENEFPIDAVFMPIRNANYSVHSFQKNKQLFEILFLEIWTNGSLTPEKAISEATRNLIDLVVPLIHIGNKLTGNTINGTSDLSATNFPSISGTNDLNTIAQEIAFKNIFIDQLELPARAYNGLKKVNVHTVSDLLMYTETDLRNIRSLGKKSVEQILEALQKRFAIKLSGTKLFTT